MLTLSQALQERFPDGQEWVRDAVDTIDEVSLDSEVHDVAQGWMRVGEGDSRLVDALFVLTEEGLGFGQPASGSAERWVPLVAITAIDAIEGTGHPLEAIEIHLSGGMAMLIGLPEPFVEVLVSVLKRQVSASPEPEQATMPSDLGAAAEADTSTLDGLPPSPWVETDVHTGPWAPDPDLWAPLTDPAPTPLSTLRSAATASVPESPEDHIGDQFDEGDDERMEVPPTPFALDAPTFLAPAQPDADGPVGGPVGSRGVVIDPQGFADTSDLSGPTDDEPTGHSDAPAVDDGYHFDPTVPFDTPGLDEVDPVEEFFAGDDHGGAALRDAVSVDPQDALRAIPYPEPFKGVSYLGGHPDHPRKRKNSVLVFSSAGVAMTGGGMGGGQFAIPWAQVRSLDVQGADEVKFTHNHRIDLNSSAVIVELRSGDVLVFEVKLRRPATMRSTLAPILSMVRSLR